jgi:hypothetical protein
VLMVEGKEKQTPIYYISRVLTPPKANYSMIKKIVLALVHASGRQRRYFQAYVVEVHTNFPLHQVLRRPELSGRLAKWAIELGALAIEFKPRPAVKGQVIADFIAEIPEGEQAGNLCNKKEESINEEKLWKLYTDGASCVEGSGAGLLLDVTSQNWICLFKTNNPGLRKLNTIL